MNETLISALGSSGTADRYDRCTVRLCDVNPVACQVNTDTDSYFAVIVSVKRFMSSLVCIRCLWGRR